MEIVKKHEIIVEEILEKYPKTRNDDFLLYAAVCQAYGLDIRNDTIANWAKNQDIQHLPQLIEQD